jgi:hypothetical protein
MNNKEIKFVFSLSGSEKIEVDKNTPQEVINERICEKIRATYGNEVTIDYIEEI